MRLFLQSLIASFLNIRRWFSNATAPVSALWAQITAPFRQFLRPVTDVWARLTLPVRSRWTAFRERFPKIGFTLAWLGTLARWGFNFLLLLIFGVWIGLFGRLPSTQ